MAMHQGLVISVAAVLLISGVIFLDGSNEPHTFSSTMEWGKKHAAVRDSPLWFSAFKGWEERITLPPPSANDSPETRAELDTLLTYQTARTEEQVAEIREQVDTPLIYDWEHAALYGDPIQFPATSALNTVFHDAQKIIFEMKERFDRVRPHFLEPRLEPPISVPRHPAYPSGHATESRLIALIFSELDPERRETYLSFADEVALNRERAGVNYPSDSAAGKLLAEQFFVILMEDAEFQELLERAKAEWRAQ